MQSSRPKIVLLATGGTIAGSAKTRIQADYSPAQMDVDELLQAVPQLAKLADVEGEQVCNVGSQEMCDALWLKLAERVNHWASQDQVDGVVITHGTDTLEETSYFLHLVAHTRKPVVMTAAMRPSTAMSADGPLNLYNAVALAVDPKASGLGVLVVANDDVHSARTVTKTSTTDVQTFRSPDRGLVGEALYGKNRFFSRPYRAHTADSELSVEGVTSLPRVDVIYGHAGMSPDLIDAAVSNGAKGLVIAGVGNGNMTEQALAAAARAVAAGVIVVRSTRVPSGSVGRNLEIDDDALGFVVSGDLNPAKARVLLQLALLTTTQAANIEAMFEKY